jgi:phage anti-repressor protein/predicted GIY-YIG superfamily endonuclease
MVQPKLKVTDVIKLFTQVPHKFVDDFFALYDERKSIDYDGFTINLTMLAKWLNTDKTFLLRTLRTSYIRNTDFITESDPNKKTKMGGNRNLRVMITPDCMKRLCMRSRSAKAETVRTYFIEIERFLINYNDQIVDGLMRDIGNLEVQAKRENRKDGPGTIYVLRASKEMSSLYKIGQTVDLKKRLATYNTGRAEDVEVLSVYRTPYRKEVELCLKRLLKAKQYKKRREIYHIDWEILQKLILGCGNLSLKLHHTKRKSVLDGEYYMVFTADVPDVADD